MTKTMTLNLTDKEMTVLESLAKEKGLTKTQLLKNALRTYQALEQRLKEGKRIFFESDKTDSRSELVLL